MLRDNLANFEVRSHWQTSALGKDSAAALIQQPILCNQRGRLRAPLNVLGQSVLSWIDVRPIGFARTKSEQTNDLREGFLLGKRH
jgi:hypothetical protein